MRILFAGHQGTPGGAQNVMGSHLGWLHAAGHTVTAVFPEAGGAVDMASALGVDVVITPLACWMFLNPGVPESLSHMHYLDGLEARVAAFATIIEKVRPEVVVCNTSVILEPVLAACRARVPWVWYVHENAGLDPFLRETRVPELAMACMGLPGGIVVGVSESATAALAAHVPEGRLFTVREGVAAPPDAAAVVPACPPGRIPLLFAGNLVRRKGVDVLFDAFAQVLRQRADVHLFVAGHEYEFTMAALLERLSVEQRDHVTFLGFRDDVRTLMGQAAAVLVPSLGDPFPLCVLEAMAAGRAVVGTHSGGMTEQIEDGVTGRVVAPGDATAFAEAIGDVIADPARCRLMGRQGQARWAAAYTRERMCRELAALIEQLPATAVWEGHPRAVAWIDLLLRVFTARGGEAEWVRWLQGEFTRLTAVETEYRNLLNSAPMRLLRPFGKLAQRLRRPRRDGTAHA